MPEPLDRLPESAGPAVHIAPDGSDSTGTGSLESPWRTLRPALDGAPAGRRVLCRGGVYTDDQVLFSGDAGVQGTALEPVTVQPYPGEQPRFAGNVSIAGAGSQYLRLRELLIGDPAAPALASNGLFLWGLQHVELLSLQVANPAGPDAQGVLIQSTDATAAGTPCRHVLVDGCRLHGIQGPTFPFYHGIYVAYAEFMEVVNTLVWDVENGHGIHFFGNVQDALVHYSTVVNAAASGVILSGTSDRGFCHRVTVENMLLAHMTRAATTSAGWGVEFFNGEDCTDLIVRDLVAYDCVRGAVEEPPSTATVAGISAGNPRFVHRQIGDLRPRPSTQVRGLAVDHDATPALDAYGQVRPGAATPGALEPVAPGTPVADPPAPGTQFVGAYEELRSNSLSQDTERPAGTATGDLLLLVVFVEDPDVTITMAGWAPLMQVQLTDDTDVAWAKAAAFTFVDDGAPLPEIEWGGSGQISSHVLLAFRGQHASAIDIAGAVATGFGQVITAPGIETTQPLDTVLMIIVNGDLVDTGTNPIYPAGYSAPTENYETGAGFRLFADSGAIADQVATTGRDISWASMLLAIRPAPDAVAPQRPEGVELVGGELVWWPNLEADMAHYVVDRRTVAGVGSWQQRGAPEAPAFADEDPAGEYRVRAIDLWGNASAPAVVSGPPPPSPPPPAPPPPWAIGAPRSSVDVPHLMWPLRAHGGRLATVEQDTIEDVRQCVHALVLTPRGARPLAPLVGIDDPTFTDVDPDQLAADLEEQEPRARVTVDTPGPGGDGTQQLSVRVELADDEPDQPDDQELDAE